jgi:hypothetical protein
MKQCLKRRSNITVPSVVGVSSPINPLGWQIGQETTLQAQVISPQE